MPITSAAQGIKDIRLGTAAIHRVYAGSTLLYDTAAETPELVGLVPTSKTQAQQDAAVQALWNTWKGHLRQDTSRGWYAVLANAQDGANPYVAEGQGYGLMLAAQMAPYDTNARTIFDGLVRFVLDHPSVIDPRLTAAQQDINMVTQGGGDSATDGDMDIAMGLLMGHRRWGSGGTHNYLEIAKTMITAIKESLTSPTTGLLELGDWSGNFTGSGGRDWTVISRPSDWMIGHFEAFKSITADTAWDTMISRHLSAIERIQSVYSPSTGLMPDFTVGGTTDVAPAAPNTLESANDGDHYYNACRTPWRFGVASSTAARTAAARMGAWAKTKSGGNPAAMPTGYALDGTTVGGTYQDLAYIAPFAVGAAAGSDQVWLNALWDYMAANTSNAQYYSSSIQLMCMIYLSRTYYVNPLATATHVDAKVRSKTVASVPYNTTAKTIALPTGTTAGDMLLLIAHCDYGAAADFKAPAGFTTLLTKELAANGDKQLVAYKVATASEPTSYTLGVPVDADLRADMLAIQNADTSISPALVSQVSPSSATTHAAPAVTPVSSHGLMVSSASMSSGTGGSTFAWTPPPGMTEQTDTLTNGYVTLTTATQTWNSTSATGTRGFGLSTTAAAAQALTMSLVIPSEKVKPPYQADSSEGTGGNYTDYRGLAWTSPSGIASEYHSFTSHINRDVAVPLVIHLHGDGFEEYTNMKNSVAGSVSENYLTVAKAAGAVFIMPRTPDTANATWWNTPSSTTYLVELINRMTGLYKIDRKRIFVSGYSGGAEEMTYFLMADHHTLFRGGGAMLLGGGGAEGLSFTGTPSSTLKEQFTMNWYVGENDIAANATDGFDGLAASQGGETFYRSAGFKTQRVVLSGLDHYQSEPHGPIRLEEVINGSQAYYGLPAIDSGLSTPPPPASEPEPAPEPTGYQATGSGGSGGSWTDTSTTTYRTFQDAAGYSSRYRFVGAHVPTKTAAVPLVIHFHGDGAYEYDNPGSFTGPPYMQIAKDIGGIGIIPLTPNADKTWWSTAYSGNWARNLILDLMKKYNIDKRRIFLSGFSGGSVMITTTLMAKYHADYLGGGAKMLGGGGNGTQSGTYSTQLLRDFPMRWHVGELDDGRNTLDGYNARLYAENSEATYRNRGFNTRITYIPGEDHNQSQNDGPAALRSLVNESQAKYGLPKI